MPKVLCVVEEACCLSIGMGAAQALAEAGGGVSWPAPRQTCSTTSETLAVIGAEEQQPASLGIREEPALSKEKACWTSSEEEAEGS